jgi:30S ribosome assembly GTPase
MLNSGTSVWIGGLARLDFLSGEDMNFSFNFQPDVTLHFSGLLKAEQTYNTHAGTLLRPTYNSNPQSIAFSAHEFSIHCESKMLVNKEIAISGLGWIGVSGIGIGRFNLHLPPNINYILREPLGKWEIRDKGLDERPWITVNSFTARNVKLKEKFKLRKSQFE